MGTRSFISQALDSGKYRGVYCHWDGYPEGVGATLVEHWSTSDRVELLLSRGSFSSLKKNFEDLGHYYDRKNDDPLAVEAESLADLGKAADNHGCEYLYVFQPDESWKCYKVGSLREIPL